MTRSAGIQIGELSRRTGCNIETIRYYERISVLPAPARSAGHYRVYDTADVRRLASYVGRVSSASRSMRYALCWHFQRMIDKTHAPRYASSRQVTSRRFGRKSPICELWSVS